MTIGPLHDDVIYYYDNNRSGFCFLVQIRVFVIQTSPGLLNLNKKKNEGDSGESSKTTSLRTSSIFVSLRKYHSDGQGETKREPDINLLRNVYRPLIWLIGICWISQPKLLTYVACFFSMQSTFHTWEMVENSFKFIF